MDFYAYCWSENDPLQVDFVRTTANQILTLEQKISRKGEISAEICTYDIVVGKMQRGPLSSIPMDTQITCFGFSPDQEKLFLGSAGRNICLHDLVLQTTKSIAQIDIVSAKIQNFENYVFFIFFIFNFINFRYLHNAHGIVIPV